MNRLRPANLHVRYAGDTTPDGPVASRCYTLTHSDATGDLFLTIGPEFDHRQIAGLYTRLMRDEVVAAWEDAGQGPALRVHCHVSGAIVLGTARWRDGIFRQELPLVFEAFRYGDRALYHAHPDLDRAPIWVAFHARGRRFNRVEGWDTPGDDV